MDFIVRLLVNYLVVSIGLLFYKQLVAFKFRSASDWVGCCSCALVLPLLTFIVFSEGVSVKEHALMVNMTLFTLYFAMGLFSSETPDSVKEHLHKAAIMATAFAAALVFWYGALFFTGIITSISTDLSLRHSIAIPICFIISVLFGIFVIDRFALLLNYWAVKALIFLTGAVVVAFNLLARLKLDLGVLFNMTNIVAVSAFVLVGSVLAVCMIWLIDACREPLVLAARMRKVERAFGGVNPSVALIAELDECKELLLRLYGNTYLTAECREKFDAFLSLGEVGAIVANS